MNHIDEVKQLRSGEKNKVYNCAQSLLMAFSDKLDISREQAESLGEFMGTGMMHGATCGTVSSALMILGMKGYDNKTARDLLKRFRDKHDTTVCADLLLKARNNGITRKDHCDGLIVEMTEALDEILSESR